MKCSFCGEEITRKYVKTTKTGMNFCSRECHSRSQYVHGLNTAGYKIIRVAGKQVYEHRWVVEQVLGRVLLPSEHVHHINGDKADNRIENLVVLEESTHHREHALLAYDIHLAKRLYDSGVGYKKLGQVFGRSPHSIREAFIRRGWHAAGKTKPSTRAVREVLAVELGNISYGREI